MKTVALTDAQQKELRQCGMAGINHINHLECINLDTNLVEVTP